MLLCLAGPEDIPEPFLPCEERMSNWESDSGKTALFYAWVLEKQLNQQLQSGAGLQPSGPLRIP